MPPTMKKISTVLAIMLVTCGAVHAQTNFTMSYSMGFGTGDVADFISKPSFRGANIEFRSMVQPNIGVGITFGWNVLYESIARVTYTVGPSSLTGKQYRYSNHFPMLLGANYYLSPDETFNPFVVN